MIGTRLEKLEKDLQLLSVMQNLLVNGGGQDAGVASVVRKLFERPERDSPTVARNVAAATKTSNKSRCPPNHPHHVETCHNEDMDLHRNTVEKLNQELRLEIERRNEVEEAARRVAIKLQQTEDEIDREKESKKALLVGTLHLKNQLQGYESRINQLEIEVGNEKTAKFKLLQDIDVLAHEKLELGRRIEYSKNRLEQEKLALEKANEIMKTELKNSLQKLEQSAQESTQKDQSATQNDQKLRAQMNQFVNKCAQIDKERERLELELRKTITNAQNTETELIQVREKLTKLENEHGRQTVLQECILNKTKSEMSQQKRKVEEQIQSTHALLVRTKGLILQLRQDRDLAQIALAKSNTENKEVKGHLEMLSKKVEYFERNESQSMERVHALMTEKLERDFHSEKEMKRLRQELKKVNAENVETVKFLKDAKTKFLERTKRLEENLKSTEEERNQLKNDLSRQGDNFKILQKISEDQTNTIQKLKADLAKQTEVRHDLESVLKDKDDTEINLSAQLKEEIRENRILEDQVEYLDCKLKAMEEDLKSHSCEDFVESSCKNKLVKIESALKSRYAEWQRSIESLKSERNEAIAAARKAKQRAEEAKTECETRVLESLSSCRQETAKYQAENQRLLSERSTKIYELESQLERTRTESSQTQRSLMGKIQQLQVALNICLGGPNTTNNPPMSAAGFGVNNCPTGLGFFS